MRGVRDDLPSFPGNCGVIVRAYGRQTTANDFRGPAYYPKLLFVLAGSTTIPDQEGEGEHAFNGCTIKMGHACLTYPKLPQLTEEVEPLMGFGNNKTNVEVP